MMGRLALWKSCYITDTWATKALASYWLSSYAAFPKKILDIGGGWIETDLSWKDLRDIFYFAQVPFPKEWVTDTKPTWELEENE